MIVGIAVTGGSSPLLYWTGLTRTVFDISGAILFTNLINRSHIQHSHDSQILNIFLSPEGRHLYVWSVE